MTVPTAAGQPAPIEGVIARVLSVGTGLAVSLLAIGVVLMFAGGISPLSTAFPPLRPERLVTDLLALRPEPFLWIGLIALIATPIVRVAGELAGLAARGERTMAGIAAAVLAVVALSVVATLVLEA